jgi:diacylglycerol kinase
MIGFINKEKKAIYVALQGLWQFIHKERHAAVHMAATIGVLALCYITNVSYTELMLLILCIAFVWTTEMLNTAIEKCIDYKHKEIHPALKYIKDVAAAAVLISAVASVCVGLIIFLPKIL